MLITKDTLFVTNSRDRLGIHALHILQTEFNCKVGTHFDTQPPPGADCVALATVPEHIVPYPSSHLRLLPRDGKDSVRLKKERDRVIQEFAWLKPVGIIACIRPKKVDNDQSFRDALRTLCGYNPPRADPLAGLSAAQKRELRIAEGRDRRREAGHVRGW